MDWHVRVPFDITVTTPLQARTWVRKELLRVRGVEDGAYASFFDVKFDRDLNDPFLFRDMKKTVERMLRARENRERVLIHGDYDADGVCSATIVYLALQRLGVEADVFLPHRERDGYGLKKPTIIRACQDGYGLVITTDCGISCHDAIAYGQEHGIDVIVMDHHAVGATIPHAYAIIHPLVEGETYPFKDLTGGGVAWKCIQALAQTMGTPEWIAFAKYCLDLAAISTIADCSQLIGENRAIVTFGLKLLNRGSRLSLAHIVARAAKGRPGVITAETIGFDIAPRINAAGRIDHAKRAFECLIAQDLPDVERLGEELERLNNRRRELTTMVTTDALRHVRSGEAVTVAYNSQWPLGIVGLVATKLSHEHSVPSYVLTQSADKWIGSGRSPEGMDCFESLQRSKELFEAYGGHTNACGFTLAQGVTPEDMRVKLNQYYQDIPRSLRAQTMIIDIELPLSFASMELAEELSGFEPFGKGNARPLFMARNCTIRDVRPVGKANNHCSLRLSDRGTVKRAIAFNPGSASILWNNGSVVDIIYELRYGLYQGMGQEEIRVTDVRPTQDH